MQDDNLFIIANAWDLYIIYYKIVFMWNFNIGKVCLWNNIWNANYISWNKQIADYFTALNYIFTNKIIHASIGT